jgi:hypothetical protein
MFVSLSKGTTFDVDSTRDDVIWGFVRGGPNTGEYCSVIGSFLSRKVKIFKAPAAQ